MRLSAAHSHLDHHLHEPRHPRQPRRQRADRHRVGRPRLPGRRRAAAVEPARHHRSRAVHAGSAAGVRDSGRCNGWSARSTADVDRVYAQRLPTPGYDACRPTSRSAPARSAAVANGFPPDSPYNADLPYDIEQWALFGEASYDVTEALTLTAGGALLRLRGRAHASRRAACSPRRRPTSTRHVVGRHHPARHR